ncbi:exo-alpha-sialidase, partial [Streptomyces cavourensis]|nr:exo-alpha-sialidase [Streptomyces cavourensis]
MTDVLLTVGTRKGLFIGRRREGTWKIEGPHFNAQAIYSVAVDTRGDTPRLLAGGDSAHWGPSVFHSDDLGESWVEPQRPAVKFPEFTGASLERVWQLQPAGPEAPDVVYAGTEPAALFRSEDRGESFELV